MKPFTLMVSRRLQNSKGKAIIDFKDVFDTLLRTVGYSRTKQILRKEYHIFITIVS